MAKGYNFTLSRGQRLYSLIAEWCFPGIALCVLLICGISMAISHPMIATIIALILLFFFRGLVSGLLDLLNDGRRHVEIEERGVGFGRETADCWIFTDGIKQIRKNRWGTISIRHHNGSYVDIPTVLISLEDFQKLENGMKKYHDFWKCKRHVT